MDRKRRFLWPSLVAGVILLPALYLLSLMPLFWVSGQMSVADYEWFPDAVNIYLEPYVYCHQNAPVWLHPPLRAYGDFLEHLAS